MGCFSMPKGIPNKRYTGEFKQMVVETMMREKLSFTEAARRFDVTGHERVRQWERIYLTEGAEGVWIALMTPLWSPPLRSPVRMVG